MAVFKRTSKKISATGRKTTTVSSKGLTRTVSHKPNKNATRTTRSFNTKTGKTKTTTTKKLAGGYTQTSSKTTGGFKSPKPKTYSTSKSTSYKPQKPTLKPSRSKSIRSTYSGGSSVSLGSLSFPVVLLIVLGGITMYFWPVTIPFILLTVASIVAIVVVYKLACLLFGLVYKLVLFLCRWIVVIGVLSGLVYILYTLLTHYL